MSDLTSGLARGGNTQLGGLSALAGALAGAGIYLSLSGALLGLLMALGICGLLATIAAVVARAIGGDDTAPAAARGASAAAGPAVASAVQQHFASAGGGVPSRSAEASTLPAATAAQPPVGTGEAGAEAPESDSEARLLSTGRFAEYHLSKAKRHATAGQHREAAVQASASLAHGDLAEARSIYTAARAAAKASASR